MRVEGPDGFDRLQSALTNDLAKIAPGRTQYTHLLDPADASVLDDIIVWWVGDDRFDVMPNASNTERVRAAIGGIDVTATRAVIAVQGPAARERLGALAPEAAAVARRRVATATVAGVSCVVAGTGYTGEDGVELAVPADHAGRVWDAVVAAGVTPAGLGARDTLRLEAGLPLHGHELGPGITPLQAGLGWVVAWGKPTFAGRGRARGGARPRRAPPAARGRSRGPAAAARRLPGPRRRRRRRRRHQRQLLADPRAGHRVRFPSPRGRRGERGRDRHSRHHRCRTRGPDAVLPASGTLTDAVA